MADEVTLRLLCTQSHRKIVKKSLQIKTNWFRNYIYLQLDGTDTEMGWRPCHFMSEADMSNTTFFTPIPIPNISKEALTIPKVDTTLTLLFYAFFWSQAFQSVLSRVSINCNRPLSSSFNPGATIASKVRCPFSWSGTRLVYCWQCHPSLNPLVKNDCKSLRDVEVLKDVKLLKMSEPAPPSPWPLASFPEQDRCSIRVMNWQWRYLLLATGVTDS